MSTPIELNDIPSDPITLPDIDIMETMDQDLPDRISMSQELDNNYDEDNISFVNHSLSQQPLLNMSTFAHSHVWTLL